MLDRIKDRYSWVIFPKTRLYMCFLSFFKINLHATLGVIQVVFSFCCLKKIVEQMLNWLVPFIVAHAVSSDVLTIQATYLFRFHITLKIYECGLFLNQSDKYCVSMPVNYSLSCITQLIVFDLLLSSSMQCIV